MPVTIIQSGTTLQMLSTSGVLSSLTTPSGVALSVAAPPRWAIYGNYAVLVNTPDVPLSIDATGTVRPLTPRAPKTAPILVVGSAGALTGSYRVRYSFVIEDAIGNVIAESDLSPVSNLLAVTAQQVKATALELSSDTTVTKRRLYRTTDNGAVYFPWLDLDGNTLTQVQDDLSDAGLSIVAAPILGTPPHLNYIAEFRGRLFGVGDVDIDHVRYTEAGIPYSWPADSVIEVPGVGSDAFGVRALVPRREALGVGRRNLLAQITGTGAESGGIPDFDMVILSKELGIESQESAKVFRDTAYFLWKDGVYSWGSDGIVCVSDGDRNGRGAVRSWFTTDDYFNRDLFPFAFAQMDPHGPNYRLFLASAGSNVIDRWVTFNVKDRRWYGPHKTALFGPTSAFARTTTTNRVVPVIGSADSVYDDQDTRTDGAATPITFDVIGKRHSMDAPDEDKYFGEVSVLGKAQANGTLAVTSRVGNLNATQSKTQYYDMRKTRQRLGRLGTGKHAQVELTNAEVGVDVELYSYEIDPVNTVGRR